MPLFFDLTDGQTRLDNHGTELPDAKAAGDEALLAAGEMLKGMNKESFWSGEDWMMKVVDEAGQPVVTLRFSGQSHQATR